MSHNCQAIAFACMDFRLHAKLHEKLNQDYGPTGYDLVHIAGGGGAFLADDAASLMMKQVDLSVKLHQSSEVVMINHEDCGAYGGQATFTDANAEHARHDSDLEKAAALIAERHPDLTIKRLYQHLDGTFEDLS